MKAARLSMSQQPLPRPPPETAIASWAFWILLVALVLLVVVTGPVLTSDGPSHLAMAHFMTVAGDPAWPMVNRLYELNLTPSPNLLGHLLMAGLMLIFPPLVTEQIVQIICLVSVPLAARMVLRRLRPDAGWLALFFFPVALQRMFFLGLYNYCLSLSGCVLCVWAYLRLRQRTSVGNGALLAMLLIVTLGCQAAGWMEAALAIGTMAGIEALLAWLAREPLRETLRVPIAAAISLAPGTILFVLYALLSPGDRHVAYVVPALDRLVAVFRGDAFAPIGQSTAYTSLVLGLTLLVLAAAGGITARFAAAVPNSAERRLRLATCALPFSFLALLLIIPDEAGGGWTHTWRAQVLPYVGLTFACAVLPVRRPLRCFAITAAGAGSVVMLVMAVWVQARDVPAAAREFDEADALIGPHCTVAPILTQFKLDPANSARLFWHPLFHIASRFELQRDRPVLFSYVARLPIYPVRYRTDADPQRLLYGWLPGQRDTRVYHVDIAKYEAASGIPVDYVLLWDFPEPDAPGPYHDIRTAVAGANYRLVRRSSGGRLELYQRPGPGGCAKP
jgi:hypothetical protein